MPDQLPDSKPPIRIGAVAYLNARPLIHGLADDPRVSVTEAVPSALPALLDKGDVDVALVPVVDTARADRSWRIVSDACIGADGPTLTVRVFSRVDPADITTLSVDGDSHTSVALASILWREKYGRALNLIPFDPNHVTRDACEAVLLIGDKVINPLPGMDVFSTQIDLGTTWKSLTGLPFVFAVWVTAREELAGEIAPILERARDAGVARAKQIAAEEGPRLGWPVHLAEHYLTRNLNFTLTDAHRRAMTLFGEWAARHQLVAGMREFVFA